MAIRSLNRKNRMSREEDSKKKIGVQQQGDGTQDACGDASDLLGLNY